MESVDDWSATIQRSYIKPYHEVAKGFTSFAENDVLIAKITPCMENGKCAIARRLANGIGFGSTEFHVLRATNRVLPEWLFYFWRFPSTRQLAERNMTGSGGQQRVPTGFLEELPIPLPPLTEQRRIAAQLEQADRLRRTRRYTLELSDTFLPAIFRKLFGDPSRDNHWRVVPLGELITLGPQNGLYKPSTSYGSGTRIVRIDAYQNGSPVDFANLKRVQVSAAEIGTYGLEVGDFLINRVNSRSHLGKATRIHHLPEPAVFESNMMRFRIDEAALNPMFAMQCLQTASLNQQIQKLAKDASNQSSINQEDVEGLQIMLPPIAQQQHFAKLVTQHERLRATQRESLRQAEHLFQTLLHRAFATEA